MSDKRRKQQAKRLARREAQRKQRPSPVARDALGRTHLVVHRDAHGSVQRLTLSQPLFNDPWQNDVTVAAASTAHGLFSDGHELANAVELGRNAMAATSKIADGFLAQAKNGTTACAAGCAHCCYQSVGVTAPEAFAIHDYLVRTRSPSELEAVAERMRRADDATRGMTSAERRSPDHPCPFLENERCSIYEVRPLTCRGVNSLDASVCERTLRDAEARAEFLAGTTTVPFFLEPIRTVHAVTAGVQLALSELHGLIMVPLELTTAMRVLWGDPEGVARAWLSGEDPFESARGGDSSDTEALRQQSGRRAGS